MAKLEKKYLHVSGSQPWCNIRTWATSKDSDQPDHISGDKFVLVIIKIPEESLQELRFNGPVNNISVILSHPLQRVRKERIDMRRQLTLSRLNVLYFGRFYFQF